jgi:hypothetical protein
VVTKERIDRRDVLHARVHPDLKKDSERVAAKYFDGNESTLLRESVRLMVNLRDELGPRFEIVIAGLISERTGQS